ncbi:hypothetical protein [Arthrobacter sp. FW306-04-A]|uniref:hypothetical protein n=1 Tax=Arthrobacter sp. FW306-04-A TaxID=2879619 RepID=UPI0037BEBAD8|nr:hypothetical protein LFT43_19890 [Arthrobacter sp. FW306-04-A]
MDNSEGHLRELDRRLANLKVDQQRAQDEMERLNSEDEDRISGLRDGIRVRREHFKREWAARKVRMRTDRDNAIRDWLRAGRPQAEIMRVIGSSNTQLLSKLAKEVALEQADLVDALPKSHAMPAVRDAQILNAEWHGHPHSDVHGWYLSQDGTLYLRFDTTTGDPSSAESYVATVEGNMFIRGSKGFFDHASMTDVAKHLQMLRELLDGTYKGKLHIKPSPYAP